MIVLLLTGLIFFIFFLFCLFKVASDADERIEYVFGGYKEKIEHPQEEPEE